MKRLLTLSLLALLLAIAASPALAARSGSNGGKRGSINVVLANDKADPASCTVRASGKYLAAGQNIYLAYYPLPNAYALTLGVTNDAGGIDPAGSISASRVDWDNSHTLLVITDGWNAPLGLDGRQAVFSIANSCA